MLLSPPAWTQDFPQLKRECTGLDGVSVHRAISACTVLISSGSMLGRDLSLAHTFRGSHLTQLRQFDLALVDLDSAVRIDPSFGAAYTRRGLALLESGRPERALNDFEQAVRLDSGMSLSQARQGRCDAIAALGHSDAACGIAAGPRGGTTAASYIGCHAENTGIDPIGPQGRVLSLHCLTSSPGHAGKCPASAPMTVEQCVQACASRGYHYAGLQYTHWCHCGNELTPARPSNACTMPCAGNATQICGGNSAISVFRVRQ
jgi:hypothetical protein